VSEAWRVIQGNSMAVLQGLDAASVDMVLTDPPYSSGGFTRGDRTASTTTKYTNNDASGASSLPAFAGDNRDQRGWLVWCGLWLAECLRVAKPGAVLACFTDWRQLPSLTDAVQIGGWVWRGVSAWQKPDGRPQLGRPSNDCEFMVWATAGARAIVGEVGPRSHVAQAPRVREHQTEKPLGLLREWVKLAPPGGVVLDPFAGSGSTGEAAMLEGRRFIGIEITDQYTRVARARLGGMDSAGARETPTQPTLFGLGAHDEGAA